MQTRLRGLQTECDLLRAELATFASGVKREFDYAPNGQRIDITDIWTGYLTRQLTLKTMLRDQLIGHYANLGFVPVDADSV